MADTKKQPAETRPGRMREIVGILARHRVEKGVTPEGLRAILEELGPTFVKLGQILSMRTDILPKEYCAELEKLRVEVAPMPLAEVEGVICAATGKRVEELCEHFEAAPVGSASIAQAHRARLKDGSDVVFKVQRPGIRATMAEDIALLRGAGRAVKLTGLDRTVDFNMLVDEMEAATREEMDFCHEADNLRRFAAQAEKVRGIACPKVFDALSSETVLCMEYVDGISPMDSAALREAGLDPNRIGMRIASDYIRQVTDEGFFHADPHPGNLRLRGEEIVWIDMGMMGQLTERDRRLLRSGMQAVAVHDVESLRRVVLSMGRVVGPVDMPALTVDIDGFLNRYESMDLGQMDLSEVIAELLNLAQRHHIAMPAGMTLLSRGVLTLEGLLRTLSPDVSVLSLMKEHFRQHMLDDFSLREEGIQFLQDLHGSFGKTARLPGQLSDALRTFARGESRINAEVRGVPGWTPALVRRLVCGLLGGAGVIAFAIVCTAGDLPLWLGLPAPAWPLLAGSCALGCAALWQKPGG